MKLDCTAPRAGARVCPLVRACQRVDAWCLCALGRQRLDGRPDRHGIQGERLGPDPVMKTRSWAKQEAVCGEVVDAASRIFGRPAAKQSAAVLGCGRPGAAARRGKGGATQAITSRARLEGQTEEAEGGQRLCLGRAGACTGSLVAVLGWELGSVWHGASARCARAVRVRLPQLSTPATGVDEGAERRVKLVPAVCHCARHAAMRV